MVPHSNRSGLGFPLHHFVLIKSVKVSYTGETVILEQFCGCTTALDARTGKCFTSAVRYMPLSLTNLRWTGSDSEKRSTLAVSFAVPFAVNLPVTLAVTLSVFVAVSLTVSLAVSFAVPCDVPFVVSVPVFIVIPHVIMPVWYGAAPGIKVLFWPPRNTEERIVL